jgi:hypothetical protein
MNAQVSISYRREEDIAGCEERIIELQPGSPSLLGILKAWVLPDAALTKLAIYNVNN